MYVASHTRFQQDYVRTDSIEDLEVLVQAGYGARMSNPQIGVGASLIVSANIKLIGTTSSTSDYLPKVVDQTDLDSDSTVKRRREQAFLRAHLLQGRSKSPCTICHEELPENMLVAAHLKKRAKCTREEKLDFDNVATLMCKLGCDDLYERGYLIVESGRVRANAARSTTVALDAAIAARIGKEVANWAGSSRYYEWHAGRSK